MISEEIQLIEINVEIPRKNSSCTLNNDSKDKNIISEIALVISVFLNYEQLAKNFIHIVTEKTSLKRVFPKSFKSDFLLIKTM